jgi:hypothetical protein
LPGLLHAKRRRRCDQPWDSAASVCIRYLPA